MKAFILSQISYLKSHQIPRDTFNLVSWLFALMISAYLLILLAIPLYETATHKGYVFATDNDGGRAVETSMTTRWYNSNHFAAYGNLYYRFSHSIADLVSTEKPEGLTENEAKSKTHNFTLKLISLFALFSMGLFIGWTLFGGSYVIPLYATFFVLITTQMTMWSEWIFRPHPDTLLNFFAAPAVIYFAKFLKNKENGRLLIISAFCWGLAMAVKRSTSIFIPGILIVLLIPWNKENLKLTVKYVGYMLLAYLVVGFPQNFGFYKHIKFLLWESSQHSLGDFGSISRNFEIVGRQLLLLLPLILISAAFSQNKEKMFSWKLVAMVAMSFVPILMRKMSFNGDHHIMPLIVATMLVAMIIFLHFFPWRIKSHLALAVLLIVGIKSIGISPEYMKWKKSQVSCFAGFDEISKLVSEKISAENRFVKEPFFPSTEYIDAFTGSYWGIDWSKVTKDVKFIGLTDYYKFKFLTETPPTDFFGKMVIDYPSKSKFYNDIKDKTSFTSPAGLTYSKIYQGNCGHELWMAQ